MVAQAVYFDDGWGYSILDDKGRPSQGNTYTKSGLDQLGDEGWELAGTFGSALYMPAGYQDDGWFKTSYLNPVLVFKRRKP